MKWNQRVITASLIAGLIPFCFACKSKLPQRTSYFPKQMLKPEHIADPSSCWIFIMAGQSNMAGRGQVEPQDTIPNPRILTINARNEIVVAKEPLHWYEPERTGLDCGHAFATALLKKVPEGVNILLVPVAIGGSSLRQWLGDSLYRGVKLYSNFLERLGAVAKSGTVKAILWHQGESDANEQDLPLYTERLNELFNRFRKSIGDSQLSIFMGELGHFSKDPVHFSLVNEKMHALAAADSRVTIISTGDLQHRGDSLHFDSKGQRLLGQRFAQAYAIKLGLK